MFSSIWNFRWFIVGNVKREFRSQYLGSLLGAVWLVLNPLAMIIVYIVIFSHVMKSRLPGVDDHSAYGVYLCAGIIPWGYFTEVLNRCVGIFLSEANMIKKISFPKITLPVIVFLSSSINFLIIFSIFMLFMIVFDKIINYSLLISVFPLLLIQQTIAFGIGIFLGVINVFFRDIGHTVNIVLQYWFWFTPIVYPASILPEKIKHLVWIINPIAPLVAGYQNIFLFGKAPVWGDCVIPVVFGVLVFVAGFMAFKKLSAEMVDEL